MSNGQIKVEPGNPTYAGIYYRMAQDGVAKIFYVNYRENGKPRWKRTDVADKDAAVAIRNRLIAREQEKKISSIPTMQEAFELFLEKYAVIKHLRSLEPEISRYRKHIEPYFGDITLDKITSANINDMKIIWNRNVRPSTVMQILLLMSRIYTAMDYLDKYNGPSPIAKAGIEKSTPERLRAPTIQQVDDTIDVLKDIDLATSRQVAFAAYAGLRRNEILGLRPIDINLEDNQIYVHTKDKEDKERIETVTILPDLLDVIHDILEEKEWRPMEKFFTGAFNYRAFNKALNIIGLNDDVAISDTINRIVLHSFRHAYATELVRANAHPLVVQQMMRHKTFKATKRYIKISDAQIRDAANKLNKRIHKERRKNAD